MTTHDALRDALAEALHDSVPSPHYRMDLGSLDPCPGAVGHTPLVERILAHPAVLAALDRSDPAVGLREAIESMTTRGQRPAGRGAYIEHLVDEVHGLDDPCRFCVALAATPTASPTEAERVARNISRHIPAYEVRDRSDPAVGLHDRCQNIAAQHFCDIHWNDASLAATPTASPTDPEAAWNEEAVRHALRFTDWSADNDRAYATFKRAFLAASPTPTGEREP